MKRTASWALGSALLSATLSMRAAAQNSQIPTPAQAQAALQAALQNPALGAQLRSQIQASGLSPDQIRARLAASGYPPGLLDAYLGSAQPGQPAPTPGVQELAAMQALGFGPVSPPAESLGLDTGMVRVRPDTGRGHTLEAGEAEQQAESLAAGNYVFGVDVFHRATTQFLPLLAGPVPSDYKLGPGDHLVLILTGQVELAYTLQVTREGFILIPQVGQIFVANLTLDQLRSVLYTSLGRVYSGIRRSAEATTQFDISVASVRTNQVYVVGEVKQPGAYQISALGTVLTSLYAAGGITARANMRAIDVRRDGTSIASFDLYDYLLRGDTRNDIRLETGDVVFLPVHGTRAHVTGAVVRPAIYELKPGESLEDLLRAAAGFRADAALGRISIHRILPAGERTPGTPARTVIDVALTATPPTGQDPQGGTGMPSAGVTIPIVGIEDGDSVTVDSLPAKAERNFVDLKGSVYQPGRYGLEPGMKLSTLITLAGGFRPGTYAGRAHIERLSLADSTRYVMPIELPKDSTKPWSNDPRLQEYDVVTIYGRPEMRDTVTVTISGMVKKPGQYPWREGLTLRDLVLMARGPRIGASLKEAEIARLPVDRSGGQLATTIRVPLDSTYLFDRDSLGRYIAPPGPPAPAGGTPEVELKPYDNVLILRQPDFELQRTVFVAGEVRFPGSYALTSKSERLADLVARAGGLTPQAYPDGVRFIRTLFGVGRINVNLQLALRTPASRYDVILQPGDSIDIPEYEPSVKISGAVNSPGSVLWQKGQDLDYYLSAAGGFSYRASTSHVSVKYANGEVRTRRRSLLFTSDPKPGPGSEVLVPVKDTLARTDWAVLAGAIGQVLAAIVTLAVLVPKL